MSASYHLCIKEHLLNSLVLSPKEANILSLARSVITNRSKTHLTKIMTSTQTLEIQKELETSTENESIITRNRIIWRSLWNNTGSFLCFLNNRNSDLQEYIRKFIFPFIPQVMALTHGSWASFLTVLLQLYFRHPIYNAAMTWSMSPVCDALKSKSIGWTFKWLVT